MKIKVINMNSELDSQLKQLCLMREDDFTRNILKPLFEAMGYERVDFNGGSLERGRDLIAQMRIPPRKNLSLTYIQSKRIGSIQNTTTSAKYTSLIHQLRQCCTEKITTQSGDVLLADTIFMACPEQVTDRFMEEIKGSLFELGDKIEILDGPIIINYIHEYKPELLNLLSSINDKLTTTCNTELINSELLSAIKSTNIVSIDKFYNDLSFFVGSIDSNTLLHLKLSIKNKSVLARESDWKLIKKECDYFKDTFSLKIISEEVTFIENLFKKHKNEYISEENKKNKSDLKELDKLKNDFDILITSKLKSLYTFVTGLESSLSKELTADQKNECKDYIDYLKHFSKEDTVDKIELFSNREIHFDSFNLQLGDIISIIENKNKNDIKYKKLITKIKQEPKYIFNIDLIGIESRIQSYKNRYFDDVLSINNHSIGSAKLGKFLTETEETLSFISKLSNIKSILSEYLIFTHENSGADRVSISPHDIFATGHDIAVYGGAGVGKTTTLQAYAAIKNTDSKRVLIYIPLNRLVEKFKESLNKSRDRDFLKKELILKIILMSKDLPPTAEYIKQARLTLPSNITIILDGLDEIFSILPSIIGGIKEFKKDYKNSQLIISSRDCVSYLPEINFLGISLLPFTKDQLNKFILGWLNNETMANKLITSIDRLNLYEHIKTPLLATITCSLTEKGVKTPSSENEIYTERLLLLTGEYDLHKNIERQFQKGELLRTCAQKISYEMHRSNLRTLSKEQMFSVLQNSLKDHYEAELLSKCLDELIDPCNVIVKDPITEIYSFGHFRFQEHLASMELTVNRGIDIVELLHNDWWRGALSLYAQKNEFSYLFEEVYKVYSNIKRAKRTFESMILAAPRSKQEGLKELLNGYSQSDYSDDYLISSLDDY